MEQRVGFAPTLMILQTIALLLGYRRIFNSLKLSIYIISKFLRIFNFVFRKRGWRISKRPASYKRHPCPYECRENIYTAVPYTGEHLYSRSHTLIGAERGIRTPGAVTHQ